MNGSSDSFADVVSRSCCIPNLQEWLDRQRVADSPDPHWDNKETGILELPEIEREVSDVWVDALEKYAAPVSAAELRNMGVDPALVSMATTCIAGCSRVYPVTNGIAVVFHTQQFRAMFFDAHNEHYRSTEDCWEVLHCILGTWRSGPTKARSERARRFLCDLVEKVMRSETAST